MITLSDAKILSAAIRAGRAALGWSQQELADRSDSSMPTIARIEAAITSPRMETVSKLIGALEKAGVEFDWKHANGFGLTVTYPRRSR